LRSAAGDPENAFDKKSAIRLAPSVDTGVFIQEKVDLFPLVVSQAYIWHSSIMPQMSPEPSEMNTLDNSLDIMKILLVYAIS